MILPAPFPLSIYACAQLAHGSGYTFGALAILRLEGFQALGHTEDTRLGGTN